MTSRRLWNCSLKASKRVKLGPRFCYGWAAALALTGCLSEPPLPPTTLAAIDDPALRVPDLAPWKDRPPPLASPHAFPQYDRTMWEAIEKHWHTLLERLPGVLPRDRFVIITFKQNRLGRVYDLAVEKDELGEPFTSLCMRAITESSPFNAWTVGTVRQTGFTGAKYRAIRCSFYFDYMRPIRDKPGTVVTP